MEKIEEAYRVRDTFYEQYRHELDRLWHNSLFLWGFDSLLFTAYGAVIIAWAKNEIKSPFISNALVSAIAFFGLLVTLVWILLSKGSRMWQEWNENRIQRLESDRRFFNLPREYAMGGTTHRLDSIDDSLLTTDSGRFSPGRISIILPQIIWCIWFVILVIHRLFSICLSKQLLGCCNLAISILVSALLVVVYTGLVVYLKDKVTNKYIRVEDYGQEFCFEVMQRLDYADNVLKTLYFSDESQLCDYFLDYYRNIEYDLFLALQEELDLDSFDDWVESSDYFRLFSQFRDEYMQGNFNDVGRTRELINSYVSGIRNQYKSYRLLLRRRYFS